MRAPGKRFFYQPQRVRSFPGHSQRIETFLPSFFLLSCMFLLHRYCINIRDIRINAHYASCSASRSGDLGGGSASTPHEPFFHQHLHNSLGSCKTTLDLNLVLNTPTRDQFFISLCWLPDVQTVLPSRLGIESAFSRRFSADS